MNSHLRNQSLGDFFQQALDASYQKQSLLIEESLEKVVYIVTLCGIVYPI